MKNNPVHKTLENALRAERPRRSVSPGFAERVIHALPSRPLAAPPSPQRLWPRLALAGALAAAALLAWPRFSLPPLKPAPVLAWNQPFPSVSAEKVQALIAKIDQPLEQELACVLSDTRNAIQFVMSNFTP